MARARDAVNLLVRFQLGICILPTYVPTAISMTCSEASLQPYVVTADSKLLLLTGEILNLYWEDQLKPFKSFISVSLTELLKSSGAGGMARLNHSSADTGINELISLQRASPLS